MPKEIKLYDGVKVQYKGKTEIYESPLELRQSFGWDIDNDQLAKDCAREITRHLLMFGYCKIDDDNGREIYIEFI